MALVAVPSCQPDLVPVSVTIREFAAAPASELGRYEMARFPFQVDAFAEHKVDLWVTLYLGQVDESSTQKERDASFLCDVSDSMMDAFVLFPSGQKSACYPVSDPDDATGFRIAPGVQEFTLGACIIAQDWESGDKPRIVVECDYATVMADVRDIQLEQPGQ